MLKAAPHFAGRGGSGHSRARAKALEAEGMTLRQVAERLSEEGHKTRAGTPYQYTSVGRMISGRTGSVGPTFQRLSRSTRWSAPNTPPGGANTQPIMARLRRATLRALGRHQDGQERPRGPLQAGGA
jgi:hypothetical protein